MKFLILLNISSFLLRKEIGYKILVLIKLIFTTKRIKLQVLTRKGGFPIDCGLKIVVILHNQNV